jgi:hypothetical protein
MNEEEWLSCDSIEELLNLVEAEDIVKVTARKHRLFYVACCRSVFALMPDHRSRKAVEIVEEVADDLTSENNAWTSGEAAHSVVVDMEQTGKSKTAEYSAAHAAACGVESLREAVCAAAAARERQKKKRKAYKEEEKSQCLLLREIYGNPFRPIAFNPSWRTSTVVALATGIYEEKAFDRLPILADALQDAGCDSEVILNHFRLPGEHCRGCWALDLVLNKE